MRQFALTYDVQEMTEKQILRLLPPEFERWKPISSVLPHPSHRVSAGVEVTAPAA